MNVINSIMAMVNANPFLTMVLSLGGAGIITFWLKDVPRMIYMFIRREFTTELLMTSTHTAYHDMMRWVSRNYADKNFRRLKLSNGQWGNSESTITSIGYGNHWIVYKRTLLLLSLAQNATTQSERERDTLTILKLGRSRKIFDVLVAETQQTKADATKTKLYKMDDGWNFIKDQPKRLMDSVFVEKAKKDELTSRLSRFAASEQWYLDNGIPYQFGILLYGPPGTGKTSLAKAIAAYLDYSIHYLSSQDLTKIERAMCYLPDKTVVVVEDIDTSMFTHTREHDEGMSSGDKILKDYVTGSLSEVLNALDGMFSAHGRLLVATTNHVEALDPALVRPGRFDLKIEIGYVDAEILNDFMAHFFPDNNVDLVGLNVIQNLTVAELQNMVLQGKSAAEIVGMVTRKE